MTSVRNDKESRVFTMSMKMQEGGEFVKMMEITYRKRPE